MRLTLSEAARLLGTSEVGIQRWVRERGLPHHRVDGESRFNDVELLEWAASHGQRISETPFIQSAAQSRESTALRDALGAGGVHCDVGGTDRESVLRAIIASIPLGSEDDRELLLSFMLQRERLGSTAVGKGIAIPHARSPILLGERSASLTLCYLKHPIDFGAPDGLPVHTFFSLVSATSRWHLVLLARLSAALKDPAFAQAIADRAGADTILALAERIDRAALERRAPGVSTQASGEQSPGLGASGTVLGEQGAELRRRK